MTMPPALTRQWVGVTLRRELLPAEVSATQSQRIPRRSAAKERA
jgi:hypothetical protein